MDFYLNHFRQNEIGTMLRHIEIDYDREMSFPQEATIRISDSLAS